MVSLANFQREMERHISVSHVYTRPEYRGKGYASAIVEHISRVIINKGKTPCLFTDLSNPSSNRAYKCVGFVECGRVDEVTMKWI